VTWSKGISSCESCRGFAGVYQPQAGNTIAMPGSGPPTDGGGGLSRCTVLLWRAAARWARAPVTTRGTLAMPRRLRKVGMVTLQRYTPLPRPTAGTFRYNGDVLWRLRDPGAMKLEWRSNPALSPYTGSQFIFQITWPTPIIPSF